MQPNSMKNLRQGEMWNLHKCEEFFWRRSPQTARTLVTEKTYREKRVLHLHDKLRKVGGVAEETSWMESWENRYMIQMRNANRCTFKQSIKSISMNATIQKPIVNRRPRPALLTYRQPMGQLRRPIYVYRSFIACTTFFGKQFRLGVII